MDRKILSGRNTHADRIWMVVYTRSNNEKKADHLLKLQNIQSFCPTIKTKRKWADRYKTVEVPLFNSYIFVCVNPHEQLRVLQTPGVVNFVYYCNRPAIVPSSDIMRIKDISDQYSDLESVSISNLRVGDKVIVNNGILFDRQGEVLQINGKSVLIVIKQLDCALIAKVKVDIDHLCLSNSMNRKGIAIN